MSDTLSFVYDAFFDWPWLRKRQRSSPKPTQHAEEAPRLSAHMRRDIGLPENRSAEEMLRHYLEYRL